MPEYNNLEGFEITSKTRSKWTSISRSHSSYNHFRMPPLFKSVSPFMTLYVLGFIFILGIEIYATFGVALKEGVPIEIIFFLILLDIVFAYLPHLFDGKINHKENQLFVAKYATQFKRALNDNEDAYIRRHAADKGLLEKEIKGLKFWKLILYIPLYISAGVKLYLFFKTYPFFDTYQAYIVISTYSLAAILHSLCTGHVLMYYGRFRPSLRKDKNKFDQQNGRVNSYSKVAEEKFINTTETLEIFDNIKHNQKIIKKEDKYFLSTKGILFDEELNDLISAQETYEQQLSVSVSGKIFQLNQLGKEVAAEGGKKKQED